MSAVMQFSLGLNAGNFLSSVSKAEKGIDGLNVSASNFTKGMAYFTKSVSDGERELLGAREKTELLKRSLESMGGSFGMLGGFARMMLDPITIGFAGIFAGVEAFNSSIERAFERMHDFQKECSDVEHVIKSIISARPTENEQWAQFLEIMGSLSEKGSNIKELAAGFDKVMQGQQANSGDAALADLENEMARVELLKQSGQISREDAAERIKALNDQMVLQKNLNDLNAINTKISGVKSDIGENNKLAGQHPLDKAVADKQAADARVADLTKQVTELPKAIEDDRRLAGIAREKSKHMYLNPNESWEWGKQADQLTQHADSLEGQLNTAKGELPGAIGAQTSAHENFSNAKLYADRKDELGSKLAGLTNDLSLAKDRQAKLTPAELEKNRLAAMQNEIIPAHKTDSTTFEKMGFVMGGGTGNPMRDTNDILRRIERKLSPADSGGGGGGYHSL